MVGKADLKHWIQCEAGRRTEKGRTGSSGGEKELPPTGSRGDAARKREAEQRDDGERDDEDDHVGSLVHSSF